jgi:hypothetical protein
VSTQQCIAAGWPAAAHGSRLSSVQRSLCLGTARFHAVTLLCRAVLQQFHPRTRQEVQRRAGASRRAANRALAAQCLRQARESSHGLRCLPRLERGAIEKAQSLQKVRRVVDGNLLHEAWGAYLRIFAESKLVSAAFAFAYDHRAGKVDEAQHERAILSCHPSQISRASTLMSVATRCWLRLRTLTHMFVSENDGT